jgi:hypothetical protein
MQSFFWKDLRGSGWWDFGLGRTTSYSSESLIILIDIKIHLWNK